jgi:hypothetical protein
MIASFLDVRSLAMLLRAQRMLAELLIPLLYRHFSDVDVRADAVNQPEKTARRILQFYRTVRIINPGRLSHLTEIDICLGEDIVGEDFAEEDNAEEAEIENMPNIDLNNAAQIDNFLESMSRDGTRYIFIVLSRSCMEEFLAYAKNLKRLSITPRAHPANNRPLLKWPLARELGHLASLGYLPANLRHITSAAEAQYVFALWDIAPLLSIASLETFSTKSLSCIDCEEHENLNLLEKIINWDSAGDSYTPSATRV